MTGTSLRTLSLFLSLALVATAVHGAAVGCPIAARPSTIFPFFGLQEVTQSNTVTLYVSEAVRNSIFVTQTKVAQAINRINHVCGSAGPTVPHFKLKWHGARPAVLPNDQSSAEYRSTMLIALNEGHAQAVDGVAHAASWDARINSIDLYRKCPIGNAYGLPCMAGPGSDIRWNDNALPNFLQQVIEHELLHAMGLTHDETGRNCSEGLMSERPNLGGQHLNTIHTQYCALIKVLNDPNEECNCEQPVNDELHPCQPNNAQQGDAGGGPGDSGAGLLSDFVEDYDVVEQNWNDDNYGSGPIGQHCTYQCVTTTDSFGGSSSHCKYVCSTGAHDDPLDKGGLPGDLGDLGDPGTKAAPGTYGMGPTIGVTWPRDSEVVSGVARLKGFVRDFVALDAFYVTLDGAGVVPVRERRGLPSSIACVPPHGNGHSACDTRSGFELDVDLGQVPNGAHTLALVAWNQNGWLTSQEVQVMVQNPDQPATPDMVVVQSWDSMPIDHDGGYSFGERPLAALPVVATFLVCNRGNAPLVLSSPTTAVSGVGFSQTCCGPTGTIAQGACSTLGARFNVNDPGTYTGAVTLTSNDPNHGLYRFDLSGTALGAGNGPRLELREVVGGVETTNTYDPGAWVHLGETPTTLGLRQTFALHNAGASDLMVDQLAVGGPCWWTSWNSDGMTVAPGQSAWFNAAFLCLAVDEPLGSHAGSLTLRSSDTAADPFSLQLHADLISHADPRLWVRRMAGGVPGSYVWNGMTVDFGTVQTGQATSRLFEIKNLSASEDLAIANPAALVRGTCWHQIGTLPASTVPPGGTTQFRVRLLCPNPGAWPGSVTIESNDPAWPGPGTLRFDLAGRVTP